ncbi:MAG: HAD family hydrolase [Thermoplasmata archaeon]|nr:HAD family hydrolase [Thermoplasmata archaeon]
MALKGVSFDWWGTIAVIPPQPETEALRDLRVARLEHVLRREKLPTERGVLFHAYDRQTEILEAAWAQGREPSPEQQVHTFLRFARIDPRNPNTVAAVGDAIGGAILDRLPSLFSGIRETLAALKERRLAIGLISNTGRTWGRYLTKVQEALGIGPPFDVSVYSDERRVRKPDRRMFDAALAGFRLKPAEVVHIGDDVTADVAGAKAAGMRAIWFNTGYWKGASTDRADAEIRNHAELPALLEAWR